MPRPHSQYAARLRGRPSWARANTTVSSFIRCVPTSRRQPVPVTSGIARPNGRCRALTRSPPSIAASGLPPAATIPMKRNSEDAARTSTAKTTGSHMGKPDAAAVAPYDSPITPTARHTRAMSRSTPRSNVLHNERIEFIVNILPAFVKAPTEPLE